MLPLPALGQSVQAIHQEQVYAATQRLPETVTVRHKMLKQQYLMKIDHCVPTGLKIQELADTMIPV